MTETYATPPDTLKDMMRDVLVRSTQGGDAAGGRFWSFGQANMPRVSFEESLQPSGMDRMFSSKFGSEAASRVGNETRTLSALGHVSSELIAEGLKVSGQLAPDDRILLSSVSRTYDQEEQPVVVVLTDREHNQQGELGRDVRLPAENIEALLRDVGARLTDVSQPASSFPSPEINVLDLALRSGSSVTEMMQITRPEVIYFPRPEMIDLCAPFPALRIEKGNEVSTSGVLCRNQAGELGITACFHGTGPVGTKVKIDGREYQVTMADRVQDLVFIPVEDAFAGRSLRCLSGVRQKDDLAPARDEVFNFDGSVNPDTDTYAQSCDPWLFNIDANAQIRMQTTRDTDQGDSGSALIDRNDKLAGFAFRMTGYGVRPGFTDWIWAPNALGALGLTPETP